MTEPLLNWQAFRYGDTPETRAALAYWRERGWPVDDQGNGEIVDRINDFKSGYRAALGGAVRFKVQPEHVCGGCGYKWNWPVPSPIELCGDCWRKTWPVLRGAAPAPPDVIEDIVVALRSLAYAAMTSGGTKGPDVALKDAIRWATDALQKYDQFRAAPAPEGETLNIGGPIVARPRPQIEREQKTAGEKMMEILAAEPRRLSADEAEHLYLMGMTPDSSIALGEGAAERILEHAKRLVPGEEAERTSMLLELLLDHLDHARMVITNAQQWADSWRERAFAVKEERDELQKRLAIVELAVPLEEELSDRIAEMCKYLAMEDGFTLAGIARLLIDCQRRMAADWDTIGQERRLRQKAEEKASQSHDVAQHATIPPVPGEG